jgi:DNA-binding transcriptional LysR family regulator
MHTHRRSVPIAAPISLPILIGLGQARRRYLNVVELRQLEYFVAVAEELHFGRAADRLHIGQPAVSQQIRRLERELGAELLDRSPRHVRLTAAGESLLPEARAVMAAAARARAAVTATPAARTGKLRLGTSVGLGERLERVLDAFAGLAPGVTLELVAATTDERLARLADGTLDAAFVRSPVWEGDRGLRAVPLWRDELVAAVPARHPIAAGAYAAFADLAELPLRLTARRNNPALVDLVVSALSGAGREPVSAPPASNLPDTMAVIGADGASWTVVYASHAALLRTTRVAFVPFEPPGLSLATYLALRREPPAPLLALLLRACDLRESDDQDP